MIKQHAPWTMDEYSKEITVLDANRGYVFSVRMAIDPSKKRENVRRIIQAVNNHDRLVEVLEHTNKALQKMTRLAWDGDYLQSDLDEAIDKTREANKLLTELKS